MRNADSAREFNLDIEDFIRGIPKLAAIAHRKVSLDALAGVDAASPVDTGRFRGNNQLTIGSPAGGALDRVDPSGAATRAEAAGTLAALQPGTIVYISNNLPYALPLENGHSKQAPLGIYSLTAERLRNSLKVQLTRSDIRGALGRSAPSVSPDSEV